MLSLSRYYSDDQTGEDEMVWTRGINIGEEKMHTATRLENLKVKDHLEDLGADARTI